MSFSAKIDMLRKGFGKPSVAAKSVQDLRELFGTIPKQLDREKGAVYVYKELLDVYAELNDADGAQCEALQEALRHLIELCREAESSIICHFILRTYNLVVKLNGKENKRHMTVQCCQLLAHCPPMEEHMDLFLRVSRVVLKVVCDLNGRKSSPKSPEEQHSIQVGLDFICSTNLRLIGQWSQSEAPEIRAKAIAIFHDVFDNATALLYRLFSIDQNAAGEFFRSVVDVFRRKGKFSEREVVDLFQRCLPYLESILSLGEASKLYLEFLGVLEIFERIKEEPTASYVGILRKYLKFQFDSAANVEELKLFSGKLKDLSGSFCSDPLLVEVVIFMTLQLRIHLDQIKQQALEVAVPVIDLCKSLVKFSKHCPRNHTQICSRCGSSSRHFVDFISSMVVHLAMMVSRAGQEISPEMVGLVNGFLKHKMLTLDDLSCEKKQSLLDSGLRFAANWIRVCFQLVPGKELVDLSRMVVDFKYRYSFDFLAPSYLIRLVENCFKDAGPCQEIIDIKLIRLVMALRGDTADKEQSKEVDEIIYAIINFQVSGKSEEIREMNIVQLLERPELEKYGFPIDTTLSEQEKVSILLVEMNWASRYKNSNILTYFQLLHRLNADPVQLGMTIYMIQDCGVLQVSIEILEAMKVKIQNARPKTPDDKIRRHGSLGVLNYYAFGRTSKAVVAKLKDTQLNKDTLKNDQIGDFLKENVMEQEAIILSQLEETYINYREMVSILAETKYKHFNLIYSLNQISSMLENTCRFYQICFHPRRAVEMQLLNYLLVSQKPDRVLEHCSSLGYLIENHQIYTQLLKDPLYKKRWVPSLDNLAEKATEIVNTQDFSKVSESRKYIFLNLYLSLALYEASRNNLPASIAHLQTLNAHLDKNPPTASTVSIIRGRIYHTLFRLITAYHLPPPRGMSVRIFIRLMLGQYNEIQKLPSEQAFIVATSTLEMTVETLRYLTLRYDTDRIESHVEQILRFVLRRGAGLRAMQVLTMYAAMSADGEKEAKCRMLLTYLDRLLMLRPLDTNRKDLPKDVGSNLITSERLEVPLISIEEGYNTMDQTRKAVKYIKSPTKRSPSPNLFPEHNIDWRPYLIQHHTGCSCQFCLHPQYKCQALLAAAIYARLSFLKGRTAQCQILYEAISDHWHSRKAVFNDPNLIGLREEFLTLLARTFMHYGQFLAKEGQLDAARREYDKGRAILKDIHDGDLGLVEEVEMNIETLEDLQFKEEVKPKQNWPTFVDFLNENPRVVTTPVVELSKLNLKTPKVGPSRVIPRTASLLKQVARKRLKTTLAKEFSQESELISAMSGLSCGSERKPKTVSIFLDSPEKRTGELVNGKKQLFPQEASSKEQDVSPKKRGRRKKAEGETPAAPKSTRKKRIPLSPSLKTSSSNESFKDILVKAIECSTPKTTSLNSKTKGRTTSKKPKLTTAFPKLKRTVSKSPEIVQNHSFNSSFRDVLLQSFTEGPKQDVNDSSVVIILDDSDHEVINTSLTENHSVNESSSGLSLKKYSDRKLMCSQGSLRKATAKTRLQFDSSSVIDITTPVSSPVVVLPGVSSSECSAKSAESETKVVKRTRGRPKAVKSTSEITPEWGEAVSGRATKRKVRGRNGED